MHKTDTDTLIELYYEDRLMEQQRVNETNYGVLSVRAYYHHDSLCVEVIKARDVIPLDPNGKFRGRVVDPRGRTIDGYDGGRSCQSNWTDVYEPIGCVGRNVLNVTL